MIEVYHLSEKRQAQNEKKLDIFFTKTVSPEKIRVKIAKKFFRKLDFSPWSPKKTPKTPQKRPRKITRAYTRARFTRGFNEYTHARARTHTRALTRTRARYTRV